MPEVQDGTCSVSTCWLQGVDMSKGQKSDWVGQMQDSSLHCIPDCSVTHHIFLREHSLPSWRLGHGPGAWDTTPTLSYFLCHWHTLCRQSALMAWRLFEVTFKRAPTESLREVRQDASVTHSSSFIQGSVLLLTTWICFIAKNGQDRKCTDSLTLLCLSKGTSSS